MKKIFAFIACAALVLTSCKDDRFEYGKDKDNTGILSLASLTLNVSEEVVTVTKADPADDSYTLSLYDASNALVWEKSYGEVKASADGISLPAGEYVLNVRSTAAGVPEAKFSAPVYGTSEKFTIAVGQTTSVGTLTCTLLQCAVTVNYNDEFLTMVTGDGSTSVEVTSGNPLEYRLSYNGGAPTYERRIGYFAVNNGDNTTMTVTFKGLIEGKNQKMTTSISGIKARDWHIITFMKKVDASGNASFAVEIDGLVADAVLDNDVTADEEGDGNDPNAPTGDGGIQLVSTCAFNIDQPVVVPATGSFDFTMKALIPNGARKFTVDIASTNEDFIGSVNTVGGTTLDLINPSEAALGVFGIVPFPHGADLLNKTEIDFNLAEAQTPLLAFKGSHTFTMNVTDNKGCRKSIALTLVVE